MSILDAPSVSVATTAGMISSAAVRVSVRDARFNGGAVGDAVDYGNCIMTSGSALLTRSSGTFAPTATAGKKIIVRGAGAGGSDLTTTVLSRAANGSSLTLATSAASTISGQSICVGTDDTAAFDAARAASAAISVPPGYYIYDGAGLESSRIDIEGVGAFSSKIRLGSDRSLVSSANAVTAMSVRRLGVFGGYGAVRHTSLGYSVQGQLSVTDNYFAEYTRCAVSSTLFDQPYWQIQRNTFSAASDIGTFGISLNGDNAQSVIDNNQFFNNGCHLKLGGTGGGAVHVSHNDFIRFGAYTTAPRIDLWISGASGDAVGSGLLVESNKFGSENVAAQDYRVLVAESDPTTGWDDATRRPLLGTVSALTLLQSIFANNGCSGRAGNAPPFLTLGAVDVRAVSISKLVLAGTVASNIVSYLFAPPDSPQTTTNVLGPMVSADLMITGDWGAFRPVNYPGHWSISGDTQELLDPNGPLPFGGAGDAAGYIGLLNTAISTYGAIGTATIAPISDVLGGSDAALLTFAAPGDCCVTTLPNGSLLPGMPVYVEFDAMAGGSAPAASLVVDVATSGVTVWSRHVPLAASGWRRYRLLWVPRAGTAANQFRISLPGVAAGTLVVGRVRLYHSREPVNVDGVVIGLRMKGDAVISGTGKSLGFYGSTGTTKPTVTGSRSGNAALASLLSALSAMGLVSDSTS